MHNGLDHDRAQKKEDFVIGSWIWAFSLPEQFATGPQIYDSYQLCSRTMAVDDWLKNNTPRKTIQALNVKVERTLEKKERKQEGKEESVATSHDIFCHRRRHNNARNIFSRFCEIPRLVRKRNACIPRPSERIFTTEVLIAGKIFLHRLLLFPRVWRFMSSLVNRKEILACLISLSLNETFGEQFHSSTRFTWTGKDMCLILMKKCYFGLLAIKRDFILPKRNFVDSLSPWK